MAHYPFFERLYRRMKLHAYVIGMVSLAWLGLSNSHAGDDFQIWLDVPVSGTLTDRATLTINEQFKIKNDANDLQEYHTDIGITHAFEGPWKAGLNLRQQYEEKKGVWLEEQRIHTHLTYSWTWHDISFSDRNRLELRLREKRKDIVRYRNKLSATFPVTLGNTGLKPYVSEELFVDSDAGELTRSRLAAGLKTKLQGRYSVAAYYLWEANDKARWESSHILGFKTGISF